MLALLALLTPGGAFAAVTITFYSHDFDESFPHAFITLTGTLDATGERVSANYGYTARTVSPAILLGSVSGRIQSADSEYIADSDRQFELVIDDATYARVMATVTRWGDPASGKYNLNRRNCIHFVAEIARLVGLQTNAKSAFFKKPRSFLQEVRALNAKQLSGMAKPA